MKIIYLIWEALKLIPAFWNGVWKFFSNIAEHPALRFLYDLPWKIPMWLQIVIVAVIYLVVCVQLSKLPGKAINAINSHMCNHNYYVTFNSRFYVIALVLMGLDAFSAQNHWGSNEIVVTLFGYLGLLALLIAVVRSFIKAKWRAVYFIPLQLAIPLAVYVYILLWAPAIAIALFGIGASSAASAEHKGKRCPHCGGYNCSCSKYGSV